jgi:hypothetical protein
VLPVPGDVRGLPGPVAFRVAALDCGQAVIGGGIGVIPELVDHWPSSAPPSLQWRRFDIESPVADPVPLADAQYELTEAIRDCASVLAQLPKTNPDGRTEINDELAAARRAGERINLPPSHPAKAVALVAQAERMAAVLVLVGVEPADPHNDRSAALVPLVTAVRRARLAGYNATL